MDILLNLEEWLRTESLEDILEQSDLEPADALYILWAHGHLTLPVWLEKEYMESE